MSKPSVWITTYKGKRTTYSVQWRDPETGKRRTKAVGGDKAYARRMAAERFQELQDGISRDLRPISFRDFTVEHLERIAVQLAEGTHGEHERTLRQFQAICDPRSLTVVDFSMLEKFRDARVATGSSPATTNKELRTLQSAFARAVQRGYLRKNPFTGNRKALYLPEVQKNPTYIDPAMFEKLLGVCEGDLWRGIALCAYDAGLRQGEIRYLEWSDVNLKDNVLQIRNYAEHATKSRRIRAVPISERLRPVLLRLQAGRFKSKLVFTNMKGKVLDKSDCHHSFQRRVIAAGFADEQGKALFSIHDLRRSFGTNHANSGASPKILMELMGHSKLETTMTYYVSTSLEQKKAAVAMVSAMIAAGA